MRPPAGQPRSPGCLEEGAFSESPHGAGRTPHTRRLRRSKRLIREAREELAVVHLFGHASSVHNVLGSTDALGGFS